MHSTRSILRLTLIGGLLGLGAPAFAQSATIDLREAEDSTETVDRVYTLEDAKPDPEGIRRMAVLRGLDKVTGRFSTFNAPAGVPVSFGSFAVVMRTCTKTPPEEPPEVTAFLEITDTPLRGEGETEESGKAPTPEKIFSGWMFASSPALNAVEHPVYDVWVIDCKTDAPSQR